MIIIHKMDDNQPHRPFLCKKVSPNLNRFLPPTPSPASRNWEIANKAARKLEEELDLKALGVEPPKKADHISIQSAVDLYLKDMAELERCIIIERVKGGMRHPRLRASKRAVPESGIVAA
jgi:hypothetical protein